MVTGFCKNISFFSSPHFLFDIEHPNIHLMWCVVIVTKRKVGRTAENYHCIRNIFFCYGTFDLSQQSADSQGHACLNFFSPVLHCGIVCNTCLPFSSSMLSIRITNKIANQFHNIYFARAHTHITLALRISMLETVHPNITFG